MLSLAGRASRRDYIVVNLLLGVGPALFGEAIEARVKSAVDLLPDVVGAIVAVLLLLVVLALGWIVTVALPVRRLHDLNLSGWYFLLILLLSVVPYAGPVIAFVWLVFVPGTKGRNRFGADPRGAPDQSVVQVFDGPPTISEASRPEA